MTRPLFCLISLSLVSALACGKGAGRPDSADGSGAEGTAESGGGGTATTIHLVVAGGPHAGTYDAKSGEITCSQGIAGKGVWGNQYSVTGKKPNEFSSLQLIVPDTKDAADGTDRFLLTVGFGELFQPGYSDHTINTQSDRSDKKEGTGTVKVDDQGKSGKVTFKGKTPDGVSLEGTIDCHQLMRAT
jgi:hypothetical protein